MEIPIETSIPNSQNRPDSTDSEPKLPISDQQPEISGSGTGGETPATPELETPKNEKSRTQNQSENSKSDFETETPVEKTEKNRILAPKNGSVDRAKVPKSPNFAGKANSECKTPTPVKQTGQRPKFSGIELPKNGGPDRLKVPKAFKYPERYMSPTDLMMSPISKGLLARSRKGAVPSKVNLLVPMHELRISEISLVYQS